jgi:aminoacrylate hydrolase
MELSTVLVMVFLLGFVTWPYVKANPLPLEPALRSRFIFLEPAMPVCPLPDAPHGGGRLYYEERGAGEPLLFVAGLGGMGSFWASQLEAFAATHRVITFDHRGTGQSTHSPIQYSIAQMADDVLVLLDHLGIERTHYAGHSTGGAIGQHLAAHAPGRIGDLILSSTWPRTDAYFRRLFEVRKSVLETQGVGPYTQLGNLVLFAPYYFTSNAVAIDARAAQAIPGLAPIPVLASRIDAILAFDAWDALPGITHRSLVVCAKDDMVTPAYFSEQLAARLPNATLVLMERGGHFCPAAEAGEYNGILRDFLTARPS